MFSERKQIDTLNRTDKEAKLSKVPTEADSFKKQKQMRNKASASGRQVT